MRILYFIILNCLLLIHCEVKKAKPTPEESLTTNQISDPIDSLIHNIVKSGDVHSFQRASIYFMDYSPEVFLPLAIKMTEFNNYCYANMEVYFCFEHLSIGKKSDAPENILAIYFLNKAINCGEEQALEYKNKISEFEFEKYIQIYNNSKDFYQGYKDSVVNAINKNYKILN